MTIDENDNHDTGLVTRLSPKLKGKDRRHLRSLAHHLNPIVLVGQNGVTEALVKNFESALLAHELVKVKVHDADETQSVAEALFEQTGAQLVQLIGKTLVFYKAHPKKPEITLPGGKS
jgi:RNA-binding protein